MRRVQVLLLLLFLISTPGIAQNLFKGKIIDKSSHELIENANFIILGTTSGTNSNSDGIFELKAKKKKTTAVISSSSCVTFQAKMSSK